MRDGEIHYKLYLLKLTMAVDNFVFRIIKVLSILMFIINLLCIRVFVQSNGHTSLSTALVKMHTQSHNHPDKLSEVQALLF